MVRALSYAGSLTRVRGVLERHAGSAAGALADSLELEYEVRIAAIAGVAERLPFAAVVADLTRLVPEALPATSAAASQLTLTSMMLAATAEYARGMVPPARDGA